MGFLVPIGHQLNQIKNTFLIPEGTLLLKFSLSKKTVTQMGGHEQEDHWVASIALLLILR